MRKINLDIFDKVISGSPQKRLWHWLVPCLAALFFFSCSSSDASEATHNTSDSETEMKTSTPSSPSVSKSYLLGQFDPAKDSQFVRLTQPYAGGSALGQYLREEAFEAFKEMQAEARKAGLQLTILSATRNFSYQKSIWEAKWSGARLVDGKNLAKTISDPSLRAREILKYSSMPGTSRHHWGSDIDLNSFSNAYFKSGKGKKEYEWLLANASRFGYCRPYTEKHRGGRTGYEEERWHWSYTPLSKDLLKAYIAQVRYEDLSGFSGAEVAQSTGVIEAYVQGIGGECK